MAGFFILLNQNLPLSMKKTILLLTGFLASTALLAQDVPNASFENWTSYSSSCATGEYPTGWTTSDSITQCNNGGSSAYRGTDASDLANSLHLKSAQITYLGFPIKG